MPGSSISTLTHRTQATTHLSTKQETPTRILNPAHSGKTAHSERCPFPAALFSEISESTRTLHSDRPIWLQMINPSGPSTPHRPNPLFKDEVPSDECSNKSLSFIQKEWAATMNTAMPAVGLAIAFSTLFALLKDFSQYCTRTLQSIESPMGPAEYVAFASITATIIGTALLAAGSAIALSPLFVPLYCICALASFSSIKAIDNTQQTKNLSKQLERYEEQRKVDASATNVFQKTNLPHANERSYNTLLRQR